METSFSRSLTLVFAMVFLTACGQSNEMQLFDGNSLEGWEGSTDFFRLENNAIVGGSLEKPVDQSYYLCTKKKYGNFDLKLSAKFKANYLEINGGISFRAKRVPNSNEVMGYQADLGYIDPNALALFSDFTPKDTTAIYPLWGSLVDENRPDASRYPKPEIFPVIFYSVADDKLIAEIIKPEDWNEVHITANGPDLEIKINGVSTAKYTDTTAVPAEGCICLQAHAGEPYEVWYKDIVLYPLE